MIKKDSVFHCVDCERPMFTAIRDIETGEQILGSNTFALSDGTKIEDTNVVQCWNCQSVPGIYVLAQAYNWIPPRG